MSSREAVHVVGFYVYRDHTLVFRPDELGYDTSKSHALDFCDYMNHVVMESMFTRGSIYRYCDNVAAKLSELRPATEHDLNMFHVSSEGFDKRPMCPITSQPVAKRKELVM